MNLLTRILVEKRSLVIPLAIALVANIAVYALVVYPLNARATGAEDRAAAAILAVNAASRDEGAARQLVLSKSHAEQELTTFYGQVLPDSQATARRMTYARLPELAREANVKFEARHTEAEGNRENPRVGRLKIRMVLQGEWEGVRQFLYELESSPEFLIIDDVTLAQGEQSKPLTLTVELSAYYRAEVHGD